MFLDFKKLVANIRSSEATVFFRRALVVMNCAYIMYLTDLWKVQTFAIPVAPTFSKTRWSPLFYYKRTIAATPSFRVTVFSQNKSCSKKYLLWYLLGFRNVFIERNLLYVNRSYNFFLWKCLIYVLQPSIIISALWLIEGNLKGMLFEESHCSPTFLKVSIYST